MANARTARAEFEQMANAGGRYCGDQEMAVSGGLAPGDSAKEKARVDKRHGPSCLPILQANGFF